MNVKTKGLGRGLDAIFEIENLNAPTKNKKSNIDELDIVKIFPNPGQPRTMFDPQTLAELSDSISKLGVIQPITVRRNDDDTYLIISGERRWRAAQLAGLTSIPAYVRDVDQNTLLEMALVENIQREDLNAIEIAISLQQLVDECNLTQDSLAERVGKKRSTIANYLRLLKLPDKIQLAIREDLISMGHARAIVSVEGEANQLAILKKTLKHGLSVRQVEELAKNIAQQKPKKDIVDQEFPETYVQLIEYLEPFFNQNISIKKGNKGAGKIVIEFQNDQDIAQFLSAFQKISR